MKQFIEGAMAVAQAVKLCRPGVICAYPITPQTHIVEHLAQMVADGELDAQFINVESEHSAASVVLGAEATGVRSYTATSSQGLLLMAEVLFNMAGMRLPAVLTCANRAVSAPLNIWNDHQDAMAVRDSGWLIFFSESAQELLDIHIQAFRIGEDPNVMLPVMVCMDGYVLTHAYEIVDVPDQELVDEFLPPFKPMYVLDPENPISQGVYATPDDYMETRYAIQETMREAIPIIERVVEEFEEKFGRKSGGLIEPYRVEDAERVIISMGTMAATVKEVVDELREAGQKVGAVRVICYRPFPAEQLREVLERVPRIGVMEKAISLGAYGPLYTDLKAAIGDKIDGRISGFIVGLGGRDITKRLIADVFEALKGEEVAAEFMDIDKSKLFSAPGG